MSRMPPILDGARRALFLGVIACGIGQAVSAAAAAFATRDLFGAFHTPEVTLPMAAVVVLALSGAGLACCRVLEAALAERLGQNYAGELRERLFVHLSRLPIDTVRAQRRGGLSLRFVGDLSAIRSWVSRGVTRIVVAVIVLPAACAATALLDPTLGLVVGVALVCGVTGIAVLGRGIGPMHRRLRSRRARLSSDMSERAPRAPELRLIGRMRRERSLLRRRTSGLTRAAVDRARAGAVLRAVPDVVAGCVAAAILCTGLVQGLAPATVAGALAAAALMIKPLRDVAGIADRYRAWRVARGKCEHLLAKPRLRVGRRRLATAEPVLSFAEVSHGPLSGMSFALDAGDVLNVTGANGTGKTTLLTLAAGLQMPETGRVTVCGISALRAAADPGVRTQLIGNGSPVLAGSLRRALTMGVRRDLDDVAILEVAAAYGVDSALQRLGGLDGRVHEDARNLSAGERLRLLFVRADLAAPRLILLDCPDQLLDGSAAELIQLLHRRTGAAMVVTTCGHDLALEADLTVELPAPDMQPAQAA